MRAIAIPFLTRMETLMGIFQLLGLIWSTLSLIIDAIRHLALAANGHARQMSSEALEDLGLSADDLLRDLTTEAERAKQAIKAAKQAAKKSVQNQNQNNQP